jgi:hypothetical protein
VAAANAAPSTKKSTNPVHRKSAYYLEEIK